MPRIITVILLGAFLALSAFVWNNEGSPMRRAAAVGPRSLVIEDVMQKVDARSLPRQQIEDRTVVFFDDHDQ